MAREVRRLGLLIVGLVAGVLLGGALIAGLRLDRWWRHGPDPVSIADASLQSIRRDNRLTVFVARYVAVVTSEQDRFLLFARKTLILPGTVRYDIDLSKLTAADLHWDAGQRTLTVDVPAVVPSPPSVDLAAAREYSGGGILMALTDAEHTLDAANRTHALATLDAQAHGALPMQLARDAARAAITRNFALPLQAAGIDAKVVAVVPAA